MKTQDCVLHLFEGDRLCTICFGTKHHTSVCSIVYKTLFITESILDSLVSSNRCRLGLLSCCLAEMDKKIYYYKWNWWKVFIKQGNNTHITLQRREMSLAIRWVNRSKEQWKCLGRGFSMFLTMKWPVLAQKSITVSQIRVSKRKWLSVKTAFGT